MNLLKTSTNLVVIEPNDTKFEDITIALQPAKTISVRTATYENYKVKIITQTNNVEKLITDIIAVKKGNDLVVTAADESKVIFRGFYTSCDTDDACTVTLGGGEDGVTITPDSPVGEKLSDGSFMVYTYADSGVLADMLSEADGETLGLSDLPEGTVSYIPTDDEETNDEGTNWWLVAGGVALAAVAIKAFSDNNDSDTKPADTSKPVFPDGASTTVTIDENAATSVVVYDAQATDNGGGADANITYTLTGADAAAFNIVATTGVVTLKASANYETKTSYEINVIATDPAGNAATQVVTVNVTDLADTNTVSGAIVLGPLVAEHGLQVELYQADGTTLITTAEVASNGTYTAAIGSYTGVIIAKVTDANGGTDYADEASGNSLDLSDSSSFTLLAVIDATAGGDVTAYITPLTTLAAQQAGLSASGEVPSNGDLTTTVVNNANQGVANIFGLSNGDVVKDLPDAVINPDGTRATTANTYGKILAAFSGIDQISGGVAETIKQLKDKIIGSGAKLSLSEEGQQAVVDGASNTQANNDQINNDLAEDVKNAIVPDGSSVIVDILPPEIAIDAIAVDKIINSNETTAVITGTVEAGSTVVLSIAGNNRDATVVTTATGTTWSYTLTAADITAMGQGGETITATATDRAGNDKGVTQDITLDTLLPTIAIDVIAVDNIINASEVTAAITGTVEAGSTVSLSIAGNNRTATVATGTGTVTTWSYSLTAADITAMGQGAETITATATDLAGNKRSASQEFTLDTLPPAIAIDVIATDNIINASEQTAAITGTVEAGSTVSLNIAGNDRAATVVTTATGTTWSYTLTAADITAMGQGAETITATATDLAGNDKSVSQEITVDTLFSAITIAPITGDNIINSNEVTAAITGTVETGSTVVLSLGGNDRVATVATGTGSVTTWSYTLTPADITAIGQGAKTITATATDPAGNESTANQDLILDTVLPTVTIDVIAVDNVINANEQAAVITGTVEASSTVMLSLAGNNRVTTVVTTGTGTTWSYTLTAADITAMGQGAKTITATATDLAGNDKSVSQDITLDTLPPVITIAAIAVDNIINASEVTAVITGTVEPSGTVVLSIAGNNRTATVTDNTWSYTLIPADITAMGQGAETLTATATDLAGNKSMVTQNITLDTLPPTITIDVIAIDNIINANEQAAVITGTVEASSTVMLSLAGNDRVTTVVTTGTGTTWSYTLTAADITAMGEGAKTITATATDLAGNSSMVNQDITIDTIFSAITIAPIAVDNVINANEQTAAITGTVEAGSTVVLSIAGNNRDATVVTTATGTTWSYTLTAADIIAMGQGAETITATATDLAGNMSTATQEFTVDTVLPTIAIDTIAGDNIINANEQAAVITGTVEAGSSVMLSLAGNNRVATVTGTTWSYTLTAADITAMGEGAKTITATATDLAGNTSTANQEFTLDTLPPTIAINVIAGDNIINVSEQTADITGSVEAGSTVVLSIAGNNRTATVTDTTWSYTLIPADITAMGQGAETITATATDPAGNTSTATQEFTLDTLLPTIAIDAIATDNIINANEVTAPITGTVEAGSTVMLSIAGNVRTASVATSTGTNTTWSYTLTSDDITAMGEGAETITATATDMAGNESKATQNITLDTLTPTIAINAITGDNIINASEVTAAITGTVEADSTVVLSIAGNNRTATVVTNVSSSGATWSYTLTAADITAMGQGAETITATAIDTVGNKTTATQDLTLDTLLPSITIDVIATDNVINANEQTADITGTVEAGSTVMLSIGGNNRTATVTNTTWSYTLTSDDITAMGEGGETITATATDPAGNTSTANQEFTLDTQPPAITIAAIAVDNIINANEQTAVITGTVEAGSTISLSIAGNERTATVVTTVSGTTWSYTLIPADITAMGQGAETITATATDMAGNKSTATQEFTVDTVLPTITIDVIAIDNVINANEVTADITGTVEAGSTVMLSLAGNNRVATVVTTVAGTTWSYTLTPTDITAMGEGDKTITATATDLAGNERSASQNITLDTQPPTITIAAIAVDNIINASEQTADITGTVEAGSTVMLSIAGNTRVAIVTNTTWSYTLIAADIAAMGQGAETITATATDLAGNMSTATQEITLDTLLPTITIDVIAADNIINANEVTADITGTVEAGSTVMLSLAGNDRVTTVTGTTWSYTLTAADITAMGQGAKTFTATATDPAGNDKSVSQNITLDTLPSAITIAPIAVDNIINASEVTADITGTVEAGSDVTLMIAGNERTVTMGNGGTTWSYTLIAADIAAMGEGAETITATATDTAGNTSTASQEFTLDTVLPAITIDVIAGDNVINANEVTANITGTVEAGSTVMLSIAGNTRTATVVTNVSSSAATWSYTLTSDDITAMGEGAETIIATATDPAGNDKSVTQEFTLDTLFSAITIDAIAGDNVINASEQTADITGTIDADSTVVLSIAGNNRTATVVTTVAGTTWSYTLTPADIAAMGEGAEIITATATDTAGNMSTASQEFTVDTVLPTITIAAIAGDDILNASEVTADITGTVDTGSSVTLMIAGNERTVTMGNGGTTWSYTLTPADIAAMGQGAETITATATDMAGNMSTASQEFTLDTVLPMITIDTIAGDNVINASEQTAVITGTVDTGSTVMLTIAGNVRTATVVTNVSSSGATWSYTLTAADIAAMGQGAETITTTATDSAGNESTASQEFTVDTVLPTITINTIAGDDIINASEQTAAITGTVEAGITAVSLSIAGNERTATVVTTVAGTTWSYTLTADDITAMGQGAETITATATDTAGNESTASQEFTVDTVLPMITIDTIAGDNILDSNEQTADITGTVEAGSSVKLMIAGTERTVTMQTGGTTWSYTLTDEDIIAMGEGAETITATATDVAGNEGMATQEFTIDTILPTIAIDAITGDNILDSSEVNATITGTVDAGSTVVLSIGGNNRTVTMDTNTTWSYTLTDEDIVNMGQGAETLTATATDPVGNESTATQEFTVDTLLDAIAGDNIINANEITATITGAVEAGSTVMLSIAGNDRVATVVTTVTGTRWSYTLTFADIDAMGQGAETIMVTATNSAGLQSTASQEFTVDTLLPAVMIDVIAVDNIINSNEVTAKITGTVKAGGTVILSIGGQDRVATTVTDTTWSYTLIADDIANMGEGAETITATATDLAGNTNTATQAITVDTVIAAITTTATFYGVSDESTDDTTPMLTGTLSAGLTGSQVLAVYDGTIKVGEATVNNSNNTWIYTASVLTAGSHSFTVRVENPVAGQQAPVSAAHVVNIVTSDISMTVTDDEGMSVGVLADGATTDDTTPTLSGVLSTALGAGEELAIYNGTIKLGVAIVNADKSWTFTPSVLANDSYAFTAVIQAAGEIDIANGHVIGATTTIAIDTSVPVAPTQTATIDMVSDDVGTNGSVMVALESGVTTDDTTPMLTGTLSAGLTGSQVLAVYDSTTDGSTKLGDAIVDNSNNSWTFTPSALPAGRHSFTVQVEDLNSGLQGLASVAHVVNVNSNISMTVTDDEGAITGVVTSPEVRYILLKQTGASTNQLWVGEVEVMSNGSNVALDKTVTVGYGIQGANWLPSGVTDGSLSRVIGDAFASSATINYNWVLIDLGGYYSVDSVNVYALSSSALDLANIRDIDIFASRQDISTQTYVELTANLDAINLGGTGSTPAYKTTLTTVSVATDDTTPTLSGVLTTALDVGEELAIYDGTTKLGVVTVNAVKSWSYTTPQLTNGSYVFTAVIQAINETDIAKGRVISEPHSITIDSSVPTQTATIVTVSDDVNINGSAVVDLATGDSTDDTTPTLTGTLSAGLTGSQVLAVYDNTTDGSTKLGYAIVDNSNNTWTYTPPSALAAGSHSFTAQVENLAGQHVSTSAAYVVNVISGISMTVTDDVGVVTGVIAPVARYILLKQTGASVNNLFVNEVQVISDGVNVAAGKTVTAGYDSTINNYPISGVTNGSLARDNNNGYASNVNTTDNWLLIDLGAYHNVDTVNLYALSPGTSERTLIRNVDIFASKENFSGQTYVELMANSAAIRLGGTGSTPSYKTVLTVNYTDDTTPTLSGILTTALGAGEELAIYDNGVLLDVVSLPNVGQAWSFTPAILADGLHTFKAIIQAKGELNPANGRVIMISAIDIVVDSNVAPPQTATIDTVIDDVSTNGSAVGALMDGVTTDDTTPTLTGTLNAALTVGQVLAVYDGTTKVGEANVTNSNTWTYISSALTAGSHSFTLQVEDSINGLQGSPSAAHVVNVNNGEISMVVTDDADPVTRVVIPGARYILLKQTGVTASLLMLNEIEVMSDGTNVALHKIVTAGRAPLSGGFGVSNVTDGSLISNNSYYSNATTNDNWVLIDLGGYFSIDSVNIYGVNNNTYRLGQLKNSDIFASRQDFSSQTYAELLANPDAVNLGSTGPRPAYKTTLTTTFINNSITDDTTPTLSGVLSTALGAGEELAIYDGTTKLGAAIVNAGQDQSQSWSYTPTIALADGEHTFKAVIQAMGETDIANGRVISITSAIRIDSSVPTQTATIVTVSDDMNINGSAVGDLATGVSTDDTTPTLTGTLSAGLTNGLALAVYDGSTKLGEATVTGTDWTYTPSEPNALSAGSHSFTAQVESLATGQHGSASAAHVVNVNNGISMLVTDDVSVVTGVITQEIRYILLKQTGASANSLYVNEVEVMSDGVNIAAGRTVTAGNYSAFNGYPTTGVTNGKLARDGYNGYASDVNTTDNWLLIDLGAYYHVDSVNLYALSSSAPDIANIRNVVIFASTQDFSSQTYVELMANSVAFNLGGTGSSAVYKTTVAATVGITDDTTPTFSGVLTTALGAGEELAIYDNGVFVGAVSLPNVGQAWSFTPEALADGSYVFTAVIQATGNTDISNGRVIAASSISVDTNTDAPTQTATIVTVSDDVNTNGSVEGAIANGATTDDTTPTFMGTLDTALTASQVLAVYDGATRLGEATITGATGTDWSYTSTELEAGSHSFTAQVENLVNGMNGTASASYVVNINNGISMVVTDDEGTSVGNLADGASTDDTTPTLSGVLTTALGAGEELAIYYGTADGTTKLGVATVSYANGTWTFTPVVALVDGLYAFTAVIQSIGNTEFAKGRVISDATNITVDTSVPTQTATIVTVSDEVNTNGSVEGAIANGATTDDTTPTLTGILSASLTGAQVLAVYDSTTDGTTKVGEATVINNTWTFTSSALSAGSHSFTARVENPTTGQQALASAAHVVNVNALDFVAAYDDVGKVNTNILSLNDPVTDDANPELSGKLAAMLGTNEVLAIYDGDSKLGEATLNTLANGSVLWHYTTSTLSEGSHTLTVMVENESAPGVPLLTVSATIVVDTSASVLPTATAIISTVTDDVGSNTGAVADGTSTDDTRLTLSGIMENGVVLKTGEGLFVYDGADQLGKATVVGTVWSYTPDFDLALGEHNFTVKVVNTITELVGPASTAFVTTVVNIVNTPSPSQVVTITNATDDVGNIQGELSTGSSTDDITPTLTGTLDSELENGQQISVYDGATYLGAAIIDATDPLGWSFTSATELSFGSHSFTAKVVNNQTNDEGAAAIAFDVNVQALTFDSVNTASSDTTPTISGTLGDATLGSNEQLAVYDGTTYLGNATISSTGSGTGTNATWSFTPNTVLSNGTHTLTVKIEEATSHVARLSASTIVVIDETPVSQTATILGTNNPAGSDDITLTGTLSGTISANQELRIYDDNGDGAIHIGTAVVTGASWTFTANAQGVGSHNYTVQVSSTDGGLSGAASTAFSYSVTGTAPSQTVMITQVLDNTGSIMGDLVSNTQTDASQAVFKGSLSGILAAGENVGVYSNGTLMGNAIVVGINWTFTPTTAIADGLYQITAAVTNTSLATPQGAMSASFTLNLEAIPAAVVTMQVIDDVGALTGNISAGTDTDDLNVSVTGTVTGFDAGGEMQVYDGATLLGNATIGSTVNGVTTWSYTPEEAFVPGSSHTFEALYVNSAGASNSANKASTAFNVTATDTTFSAIATTDPISGLSVQTFSLESNAMDQALDFSGFTHPQVNVVNIAGSGANTVKIDLDDVLQSGINLFNDANGWAGLVGAGKHQIVVNGDADDTVELDSIAQGGSWILEGTTTNSGHTYLVYNNADGVSQVLLEQDMSREGAIL